MAEYLIPIDYELLIDEIKFLFQSRFENIDLIINRKWNNEVDYCMNYPQPVIVKRNILECKYLTARNETSWESPVDIETLHQIIPPPPP